MKHAEQDPNCWPESFLRHPSSPTAEAGGSDGTLLGGGSTTTKICSIRCDAEGGAEILNSEGYIDHEKFTKVVAGKNGAVLVADTGTGKSECAKSLAATATKVLVVTPTRALARAAATRFEIPCYLDHKGGGIIEGSTAVCLNSLRRCSTDDVDLLVLDESEQLVRALAGEHLGGAESSEARHALKVATNKAGFVLAIDAHAGELTEKLFVLSGRDLAQIAFVKVPPRNPRDFIWFENMAQARADLLDAWERGKRPAVACGSVAKAATLARLLRQRCPVRRIALLTSETAPDYDLGDLSWLAEYDAVVYSPVIGTGVSIDVRHHFDAVWLFVENGVGTGQDAYQLASRVRYPMDRTLRICGARVKAPKVEPGEKKKVLREWYDRGAAMLLRCGRAEFVTGSGVVQKDEGFAEMASLLADIVVAEKRTGKRWVATALVSMLEGAGGRDLGSPKIVTPKALAREASLARRQVREDRINAIVAATDIGEDEAERRRNHECSSSQAVLELEKANIRAFYGQADEEAVRFDCSTGSARKRAAAFGDVALIIDGHQAALRAADVRALRISTDPMRLEPRELRADAVLVLLRAINLSLERPNAAEGRQRIDKKLVDLRFKQLKDKKTRERLKLLGLEYSSRSGPIRFVSGLLRCIGLKLHHRQLRSGSGRGEREYYLSNEDLDRAWRLSGAHRTRMAPLLGASQAA